MKKAISLLISSIMLINTFIPVISYATELNDTVKFEERKEETQVETSNQDISQATEGFEIVDGVLVSYTGTEANIVIPDNVTSIGKNAFIRASKVKNIVMPNSVVTIQPYGFSGCNNLTEITMSNSVTSIGHAAFSECSSLTSIEIPDNIKTIEDSVFYGCTSLSEIAIPSSVTSIGYAAFSECSSLTSIEIPDNIKIIKGSVFNRCTSLSEITIPSSVKTIERSAFAECTSLKEIEIPNGVTTIDDFTFSKCRSLTNVKIPSSVKTIGQAAFSECVSLEKIEIPSSVTTIRYAAFSECTSLNSIKIPNSVDVIEPYSFSECSSLREVTLPNNMITIDGYVFSGCSSLTNIEIPSGVKRIMRYAFRGCTSLTNIQIPNNVTTIRSYAFDGCSSLEEVEISDSMTTIERGLFLDCINLKKVIIPKSITVIEPYAFDGCDNLNIYGHAGSYTQTYAIDNDIPFMELVQVEKISLDKEEITLNIGDKDVLKATIQSENSNNKSVKWSSSDNNIVSVDSNGNIEGISPGSAVITATSEAQGLTATCKVKVNHYEMSSATITTKLSKYYYTGKQIKPEITVEDGNMQLREDIDYTIIYGDNIKPGEGSIIINGIGNYLGTKEITFKILPKAVTNIKELKSTTSTIELSWSKVSDCDGYKIYRYYSSSNSFKVIKTINDNNVTTFTDINKTSSTTYRYKIKAYKNVGDSIIYSDYSNEFSATTKPLAPKFSTGSTSKNSVTLTWSSVARVDGYEIYRCSSGNYNLIGQVGTTTTYTDAGRTSANIYTYKVRAYKLVNEKKIYSNYSSSLKTVTKPLTPKVTLSSTVSGKVNVSLENCSSKATGYKVYMATSKTGTYSLVKTTTNKNYTKTGLTKGKTYYFKVKAYRTVDEKNIYGDYSSIKYIKCK